MRCDGPEKVPCAEHGGHGEARGDGLGDDARGDSPRDEEGKDDRADDEDGAQARGPRLRARLVGQVPEQVQHGQLEDDAAYGEKCGEQRAGPSIAPCGARSSMGVTAQCAFGRLKACMCSRVTGEVSQQHPCLELVAEKAPEEEGPPKSDRHAGQRPRGPESRPSGASCRPDKLIRKAFIPRPARPVWGVADRRHASSGQVES